MQVLRTDAPSPLLHVLPKSSQIVLKRTSAPPDAPNVMGPRPLPLAMRAMSIVAAFTAGRIEDRSAKERTALAAACVSQQQARLLLGYNKAGRSYIAGVAAPGAQWPQQPRVRVAACAHNGGCSENADGPNAKVAVGALVHGPDTEGVYADERSDIEHSGTGVLNSSPLVLLAAAHRRMELGPKECLAMGQGIKGV